MLVKDGKPISGSGNGGAAVGGHHHDGTGHHDGSEVGGMPSLLDVGLSGHHPGSGHHFHHG